MTHYILSCIILLIWILPIVLGIGYLLSRLISKCLAKGRTQKKQKSKNPEKQKFWFYSLWLPCAIFTSFALLITCFSLIKLSMMESMAILFLMALFFAAFNLLYHLVYFIYTRLRHLPHYVNKKTWFIALGWIVVDGILCYLIWLVLQAMMAMS